MYNTLLKCFSKTKRILEHKPVMHTVFRDDEIAKQLHDEGYYIAEFLGENERQMLLALYKKHDTSIDNDSGAFFPILSSSTQEDINRILEQSLKKWLKNYKSIHAFAIKTPGKASKLPLHQDLAVIDEEKYSAVAIWIPLQRIHNLNGPLHIIPRSHSIFIPYRCGTIPPIFANFESILQPFFKPIYLEMGQALFFDSRMFHYSSPNLSNENRIVVVCRIYPFESDFVTYYQEAGRKDSRIEMWKRPEDYLINKNENYGEDARPENCELLGYRYANTNPLTKDEFERIRKNIGINPQP